MRTYLNEHDSQSAYENFLSTREDEDFPRVDYIKSTKEVIYNSMPYDYSKDYLTFEALEDGTFTFTMTEKLMTQAVSSISYSLDDGETWTTTNNVDNQQVVVTTPTITSGNKVLWKADAIQYCTNTDQYPGQNIGYGSFTSSGNYNASGNIMSMLYGDSFSNQTQLPELISTGYGTGTFGYLFGKVYPAVEESLISVENLVFPATILSNKCYAYVFNNCAALITAPKILPATTLANNCYVSMFAGCTSLVTAPVLPAMTMAPNCYSSMFSGCTTLTISPALPATTLANNCYQWMFQNCTSLTEAPELPAITLSYLCYNMMFKGCSALITAPALPATTLANNCYTEMFEDCTSLTTVPSVLPATTLTEGCYSGMFDGCISLTTAPELPATTLVSMCYNYMFENCSNLNYIKAMFSTTPGSGITTNWVNGVAATGTFVKNSAATWTTTGTNGIPSGWTVETAAE